MSTAIMARPLRAAMANARLAFAGARLSSLLAKANFNRNQPRAPAGTREGGRWVRVGAEPAAHRSRGRQRQSSVLAAATGRAGLILLGEVSVSRTKPGTIRKANRTAWDVAKELAKYAVRSTAIVRLAEIASDAVWLYQHWDDIVSYLDAPRPLEELRERALKPRKGYEVHHIVEKTPARRDGLPEELIESFENRVLVPRFKHWEITSSYVSYGRYLDRRSLRDNLRGSDWSLREQYGLDTLVLFKILRR